MCVWGGLAGGPGVFLGGGRAQARLFSLSTGFLAGGAQRWRPRIYIQRGQLYGRVPAGGLSLLGILARMSFNLKRSGPNGGEGEVSERSSRRLDVPWRRRRCGWGWLEVWRRSGRESGLRGGGGGRGEEPGRGSCRSRSVCSSRKGGGAFRASLARSLFYLSDLERAIKAPPLAAATSRLPRGKGRVGGGERRRAGRGQEECCWRASWLGPLAHRAVGLRCKPRRDGRRDRGKRLWCVSVLKGVLLKGTAEAVGGFLPGCFEAAGGLGGGNGTGGGVDVLGPVVPLQSLQCGVRRGSQGFHASFAPSCWFCGGRELAAQTGWRRDPPAA